MAEKQGKFPGYTALLPPRVRYDKDVPATGKLLYAEITAMTDVTGYCWASNGYLGSLVGVGKDRAARLVALLEARGYVSVDVVRDDKNVVTERRIFVTDLGFMRLPPPVKNTGRGPVKNTGRAPGENTGRVHIEKNDKSIEHVPPYNPPNGGRTRRDEHKDRPDWAPEQFERLWKWYPTGEIPRPAPRGNRQRAIRAWDKLQPSEELIETIAEALSRQARSDRWQEGVGVPHLSTYLNGYGWEEAEDG